MRLDRRHRTLLSSTGRSLRCKEARREPCPTHCGKSAKKLGRSLALPVRRQREEARREPRPTRCGGRTKRLGGSLALPAAARRKLGGSLALPTPTGRRSSAGASPYPRKKGVKEGGELLRCAYQA